MHGTAGGNEVRASSLPTPVPPYLQVRNAQLDKEASELRQENETLLRSVEDQKHSAVNSAQVPQGPAACRRCRAPVLRTVQKHPVLRPSCFFFRVPQYAAMEARSQQLQDELTAAYKEKAGLAEQSLQATRQLQARTAPHHTCCRLAAGAGGLACRLLLEPAHQQQRGRQWRHMALKAAAGKFVLVCDKRVEGGCASIPLQVGAAI